MDQHPQRSGGWGTRMRNFKLHDDVNLIQFCHSRVPGLCGDEAWIPAFAGMTPFAVIHVAVYKIWNHFDTAIPASLATFDTMAY